MLRDVQWSEDRFYRTGTTNEPIQFYLDGLCNSNQFDLLLGYFSSAAISILSLGFATFLNGNGTVRLIINNVLSQQDADAITLAKEGKIKKDAFDLKDIKHLHTVLNNYGKHFFECLAWLIAHDRIKVVIIQPKNGQGIAHYKSGSFSDGKDSISFRSSCNFTAYGLLENLEELDCNLSWESGFKIQSQAKYFDAIFSGEADFVEYLDPSDIVIAIKNEFGDKSLNELVIQENELFKKKASLNHDIRINRRLEKILFQIEEKHEQPKFPYKEGPREYQIQAYNNWEANNEQGIFAMATGTGKTITALNCVLEQFKNTGSYKAIIIVPTIGLVNQWEKECRGFNFKNIIKINSETDWQNDIAFINTAKHFLETSFIVIVTYSSFNRSRFQEFFKKIDRDTILIGDEVHNMGSPSIVKLLPNIHLKKRIGLSATPKRIYDEDGGEKLERFFNDEEPYTFSYTMDEAIHNGVLCHYLYFPHLVELTSDEFEEYINISKKLAKFFDGNEGKYKKDPIVEILLLQRKRIIHKAVNKKSIFEGILQEVFKEQNTLHYTLVYVPEGIDSDYSLVDNSIEDEEDRSLINQYTRLVSRIDRSVTVKQYTSDTIDRESIIKSFENGDIQVLTSMKCLDEGIDVPRSQLAVFCSSTGNPRQFIQRRGRILRRHKDKTYAVIHDLVVVPKNQNNEDTYKLERSLVQKELERVIDFSRLADNKIDTFNTFKDVLDEYNLSLYNIQKTN